MKILFIELQYDYGDPKRGNNIIGELGFHQSLVSLGHEVIPFYYDSYLSAPENLQKDLLNKAQDIQPDLIFFILFENQFKKETLLELKSKYTTFNWFGDDSWRFDSFTKHYANCFTYCSTSDKFSVPKYHDLGQTNVMMGQWAVINTKPPENLNINYKYDVSFIGQANYARKWFVQMLKKRGIHVHTFGNGWKNGQITLEEMNDVFLHSKINLNLSNSVSFDIRYLIRNPLHLIHTLRGKKNATQMKARHFEIPYNGGFQLADYAAGIEDYLTIGKDLVCYKDLDEAITLIKYYLRNDTVREEIKRSGFKQSVNNHTYEHRLANVMNTIEGKE